jgi:hypothetical protein
MNVRRVLASVGLLCLVPIGKGLMTGMLTVPAAAQRALTLVAILWLLEHFVVPLVLMFTFPSPAHAVVTAPAGDVVSPLPEDEE